MDQSCMFGTTQEQVITSAGSFLDGLQQHGVMGTLKHWPGLDSASANQLLASVMGNHLFPVVYRRRLPVVREREE